MGALARHLRNRRENPKPSGGKIYKMVNMTSIFGVFVAVGFLVLMITKTIPWSSNAIGIVAAIAILCFSCILALPWIRKIENKEYKTLSYVFLGLVAACCVLWIVSDIVIISQYKSIKTLITDRSLTDEQVIDIVSNLFSSLNFLKVAIFITIQFSVASFVATAVTKYGRTMILFQAIAYASYAFVDFWFSGLLFTFSINSNLKEMRDIDAGIKQVFSFNEGFFGFLTGKVVLTILILAVVYVAISNAIMKRQDRRKLSTILEDIGEDGSIKEEKIIETSSDEPVETIEEKLEKLKNMYEKNLITQEEYEQKKSDLLKDM